MFRSILICAFCVAALLTLPAWGASHDELFGGSAFFDPEDTQEMPAEWQRQPVRHPADTGESDLLIQLSYQMADVWRPWLEQIAQREGLRIAVREGADGVAAGLLSRKEADIACFCGSPVKTDRLPGVEFHTIGIVPVVMVVHPDNPVNGLSLASVMKIYRGEIDNWAALGGPDLRVQPVTRSHCKKHPGRFRPLDLQEADKITPRALLVGSMEDVINYVSSTPGAIGYEMLPQMEPAAREGEIKILSIDGRDPHDLSALAKGEYPYYRHFTFTSWAGENRSQRLAREVLQTLHQQTRQQEKSLWMLSASSLRAAGWRFHEGELVGEPVRSAGLD